MRLDQVETPAGVIDLAVVRSNAARAADYCRSHGLAWRPHVKTHKSLEIASMQLSAGASGLTVATPHEAEVMAALTGDLLLAYPPVGPSKVERVCSLPEEVDLKVGLDAVEVLEPLAAAAASVGRTFGILIEFDAGLGRVGVPDPRDAVRIARIAAESPGSTFEGLMFYPGHIRIHRSEQPELLARLSDRIRSFIDALEAAGLSPGTVSGGSTPTLWDSHRIEGVTEVRPGTCVYNDRDIVQLGAASLEDVAYTVLTTVVSVAVPGQAVVDAGSKALSKESLQSAEAGYGSLLDRPGVTVKALSEEHGVLDLSATDWRPSIGDRVRVVPNHVCVSVNLQDRLWAVEGPRAREVSLEGRGRGKYQPRAQPA